MIGFGRNGIYTQKKNDMMPFVATWMELENLILSEMSQKDNSLFKTVLNDHLFFFLRALFTITKTWKQPKCPSKDDWIKKMWYI